LWLKLEEPYLKFEIKNMDVILSLLIN